VVVRHHVPLDGNRTELEAPLLLRLRKFGRYVRYAVGDLDAWAASCRRVTTALAVEAAISPIDKT